VTGSTDLTGRTAIVVGPGGATEAAIIEALVTAGGTVVFAPTDDDAGDIGPDVQRLAPGTAANPERLITEAKRHHGRLDILIQHRPTSSRGPAADLRPVDWTADLGRITQTAALATAFAAACEPNAAIVTLVSLDLAEAYPERATAATVSNGLVGATRALAVEWAGKPIRVNAVATGPVLGPSDEAAIAEGERSLDRVLLRAPSHRIGTPAETASLVRFLVDGRSEFITGQVIWVDGGWASLTQHAEGLRFP
jgi:NAD(P)-dependent dehydrogenase (short-subunit alcohol dehydrogenase family)